MPVATRKQSARSNSARSLAPALLPRPSPATSAAAVKSLAYRCADPRAHVCLLVIIPVQGREEAD